MTESRVIPRFPRPPIWFWVAVVAGAIATSVVVVMVLGFSDKAEDRARRNEERLEQAEVGIAALAEQVESLGGKPVVEPGDINGDIVAIPGPKGDKGDTGAPGAPGADGAPGAPGAPGADGAPGSDGADGTAGATGSAGEAGEAGAEGQPGTPGVPGPAGETVCPPGFEFMDVNIPSSPDLVFRLCAAPAI
jgi:hypothetical protein